MLGCEQEFLTFQAARRAGFPIGLNAEIPHFGVDHIGRALSLRQVELIGGGIVMEGNARAAP